VRTPKLEFWFDFASTYSYLSASRAEAAAERAGVAVPWEPFLLGPQGPTGISASGIDMAAWNALARAHCLPLFELLGGAKSRYQPTAAFAPCAQIA
jgi:2-hydroxychromene-2-carboxylate isomerase